MSDTMVGPIAMFVFHLLCWMSVITVPTPATARESSTSMASTLRSRRSSSSYSSASTSSSCCFIPTSRRSTSSSTSSMSSFSSTISSKPFHQNGNIWFTRDDSKVTNLSCQQEQRRRRNHPYDHERRQLTKLWAETTPTTSTTTTTTTTDPDGHSNNENMPTLETNTQSKKVRYDIHEKVDSIVCGGGPAGLLSAIMLAQQFPDQHVHLYERREEIPPSPTDVEIWSSTNIADRYYLIGLGGRGITALQRFGVWKDVEAVSIAVPGRKDWTTKKSKNKDGEESEYVDDGIEKMLTDRKYMTHVLPRDKLVSVLHKHINDKYSDRVTMHYGYDIQPVDFDYGTEDEDDVDTTSVLVRIVDSPSSDNGAQDRIISTKFLIVADGSARSFVNQMEKEDGDNHVDDPIHVERYVDDQPRIYKSIPFQVPEGWKSNLNYSVRADSAEKGQPQIIFDALPVSQSSTGRDYCGVLLLPENHPMSQANVDVNYMDSFLRTTLPQLYPCFEKDKIVDLAKKSPSALPKFRYVGPRLYHCERTVLVGDCIKTVKPYFGLGANSALEDVLVLSNCIENAMKVDGNGKTSHMTNYLTDAIIEYSDRRASDIKTLVVISHSLDRPGPLGMARFLIPVILDGIFRGLLPQIFAPNIINMLQNEELTFEEAAQRKLYDRIGQIAILGGLGYAVTSGIQSALQ